MNLTILIRGYLYKDYSPISSYKRKCRTYQQDFNKLINNYEKLIKLLSEKYQVNVIFTTYETTPKNLLLLIKDKNWNIELYKEKGSTQFSNTIESLKYVNDTTLIIRSDLVLTNKLINTLVNYQYHNCDRLVFLSTEPKVKKRQIKYIDVLCILPIEYKQSFCQQLIKHSGNPKNGGHYIDNIPIQLLSDKKWRCRLDNEYYKIYRGDIT